MDRDYKLVSGWYEKRGLTPPPKALLSDMGFVADERAALWLYTTNSGMMMLEGLISNPDTVPSLRRASVKQLVCYLTDVAYARGAVAVFGVGRNKAVSRMLNKLGWKASEQVIYSANDRNGTAPVFSAEEC
jgi:hypothetical protein